MLKILNDVTHVPQYTAKDLSTQWSSMLNDNPHYKKLRDTHVTGCGIKHSFSVDGKAVNII